jgi:hypothetical protein
MNRLLHAAALAAFLAACGGATSSAPAQPDASVDVINPAAVTDLAAPQASVTTTSVSLTFTATGDDGDTGTAARYDLRYASVGCPITDASFASATQVPSVAGPRAAGTAEIVTIPSLSPGTTYCFALRVADEAGNVSLLSNVATAHTPTSGPVAPQLALGKDGNGGQIITWTASDDDGRAGALASEELRFATGVNCPLTPATFTSGTAVAGVSTPASPGSIERTGALSSLDPNLDACAMLEIKDAQGQKAFSNSLAFHTPETAPAKPGLGGQSSSPFQLVIDWQATGNDGRAGTVASQALAYESGAACANFSPATFASGTSVTLAAPAAAGTNVEVTVTGLQPATNYCFLLRVQDHEGNVVFSDLFGLGTQAADVPPGTPVLAAQDVGFNSLMLDWIAPSARSPGGDTAASAYVLTYKTGAACDSSQVKVPTDAPKTPGAPEQVLVQNLPPLTPICFDLEVDDAFGNSSSASLHVSTLDVPRPAAVVDLHALVLGNSAASPLVRSLELIWTAPAAPGGGAVSSYAIAYQINQDFMTCTLSASTFISASVLPAQPAPLAPGSVQTLRTTVNLDEASDNLCFAIVSRGPDGSLSSISNISTPPGPTTGILAVEAGSQNIWDIGVNRPSFQPPDIVPSIDIKLVYQTATQGCPRLGEDLSPSNGGALLDEENPSVSVFVISDLARGVSYCAAALITDPAGDGAWSDVVAFTTVGVPAAPANLALESATQTSLSVRFDPALEDGVATGVALTYEINVGQNGQCGRTSQIAETLVLDETGVVHGPADTIHFTINRLSPGIQYCVQVIGQAPDFANGPPSNLLASTQPRPVVPPLAIAGLKASNDRQTTAGNGGPAQQVLLSWRAPADFANAAVFAYDIRYGINAACPITQDNFASQTVIHQSLFPAPPFVTETFAPVIPVNSDADQLCFAIISTDSGGRISPISNVAMPPLRVDDLHAVFGGTTSTTATMGFTASPFPAGTAPGEYSLAYLATNSCPGQGISLTPLPGVIIADEGPAGPSSFVLSGLQPSTTYCAGLKITNAAGDETWSFAVPFTTADISAPPPPQNLALTAATQSSLTVGFDSTPASSLPGTGVSPVYFVDYEQLDDCSKFLINGGGAQIQVFATGLVTAPGQPLVAEIDGLQPGSHYCLAVQAHNSADQRLGETSGFSKVIGAETAAAAPLTQPTKVRDLRAQITGDSVAPSTGQANQQEVNLVWTAPADIDGGPVASFTTYFAANLGCPITAANLSGATILPFSFLVLTPGQLVGFVAHVPAADTDSVCFAVISTGKMGASSALSNNALPPHFIDDEAVTSGADSDTSEAMTFSLPFFQNGTGVDSIVAYAGKANGPCPLNSNAFFTQSSVLVETKSGSALFQNLAPGTAYCAGVISFDNQGDGAASLTAGFTTTGTAP